MKKLLILSLLLPILAIVAQEFDESFIESLPDDIKEDIMNKAKRLKTIIGHLNIPVGYSKQRN